MSFRLPVLAFLILSIPLVSRAQSLGDVARAARAEKQTSGIPHARVITNDDISEPAVAHDTEARQDASAEESPAKEGDTAAKPAAATDKVDTAAGKQDDAAGAEPAKKKSVTPAKTAQPSNAEQKEIELQQRTDEINKQYTDRITSLHDRINVAQAELAKLQRDQIESANDFRRTVGTAPSIPEYEAQQRTFNDQIEAHRKQVAELNSELEDAREAARHAGVPHASDY